MTVWLFVALVISQTYTASLTSMLVVEGLLPIIDNIESLQRSNAKVGYSNISFVSHYLVDVLHFNRRNLQGYTSLEGYAEDLKSRKIAAIFLEAAVAKIFLAKYCKSFVQAGPTYKVGGFGFVILLLISLYSIYINSFSKVQLRTKLVQLEVIKTFFMKPLKDKEKW